MYEYAARVCRGPPMPITFHRPSCAMMPGGGCKARRAPYVERDRLAGTMVGHPHLLRFLLIRAAMWLDRRCEDVIAYLLEENRVLREQLPRRPRFTDAQRRRLARAAKKVPRKTLRELGTIVTPDTLLRWYRELVAAKYDSTVSRKLGRPRTPENLRALVVTMATQNPTWGYTRIRGALLNLGHDLSCSTIARILKAEGVSPAPDRKTTWKQFLRTHWEAIAAADFFTVEVLTPFGIVRYSVLFVLRLSTRRVEILGVHPAPYDAWMRNVARGALDVVDGCLRDVRYLTCDRDPLFTTGFRDLLASAGTKVVRLPPRRPDLNSFAERFVGSVRRECLARVIPLGERHLRRLLHEYVTHYHEERNHQGLGNRLIEPTTAANDSGPLQCRERLGGLLRFYHRDAA